MKVLSGLDVLINQQFESLRGRRVGLLTNPSAVTRDLTSAYEVFCRADVLLTALFSPEHGFAAAAIDGAHVASGVDARTGVPLHSLYGETLRPTADMLAGIDVLVCDIQDIGARYYTYAWTISYAIEAAGSAGVEVLILDRPNPLGDGVDGALLDSEYASIVGAQPIPVQHGMTLGELMSMVNALYNPTPAQLDVIACEGYGRAMTWESIGRAFVPPSPAMPHLSTAQHYPGACLLEGTTLSEGRGTALPFEICGAPFIDGALLAEHINEQDIPGASYRPHAFQPAGSKYAGVLCYGVQAHITNAAAFRPLLAWVAAIRAVRHLYPDQFAWRAAQGKSRHRPFDLLAGGDRLRAQIDANTPLHDLTTEWDAAARAWREAREGYLLY